MKTKNKYIITAISDTHTRHDHITENLSAGGDILIHSGDFTSIGMLDEVSRFLEWFSKQPFTKKIFIAGNHDLCFDSEKIQYKKESYYYGSIDGFVPSDSKPEWLVDILSNLPDDVIYLENSMTEFDGIRIWGSPNSPKYGHEWAFNKERGEDIAIVWQQIPNEADIVITHTPIYGHCDRVLRDASNVGCADLYYRLNEVRPHLHFHGHIHEGYGYVSTDWGYSINASMWNHYKATINSPIRIEYDFADRHLEFI